MHIFLCSTGRENSNWSVWRQSVGWLAVWVWRVSRQLRSLTADRACTHLTPLPWEFSCEPTSVFFHARLTWLWLITVTCLHLRVSSVQLHYASWQLQSESKGAGFAPWQEIFLTSIPGNIASARLTFISANIYMRKHRKQNVKRITEATLIEK